MCRVGKRFFCLPTNFTVASPRGQTIRPFAHPTRLDQEARVAWAEQGEAQHLAIFDLAQMSSVGVSPALLPSAQLALADVSCRRTPARPWMLGFQPSAQPTLAMNHIEPQFLDFHLSHQILMTHPMEKEVSFDPVHIRLLCANTVVFNSDTPAKLVQQLRRVRRSFGCGVHDQYRSYRTRWTITINRLAYVARLSTKTYNTFTPTNVVDITLGALIIEKYGRFHLWKCHAAQSNKLPPISFALCVMNGRRRRGCWRWRPRLALAQHFAQPGRPSMPVHFVVAGSRAPFSWTLAVSSVAELQSRYAHVEMQELF